MPNFTPRWEGDDVGTGIGDGRWIEGDLLSLLGAVTAPGWIAEQPEIHLLPRLVQSTTAEGSPLTIFSTELKGPVYEVVLTWNSANKTRRSIRAAVYALVGEIAESVSFVRQRIREGNLEFLVCTGMLDDDGQFAGHGHLIHFIIRDSIDIGPAREDG